MEIAQPETCMEALAAHRRECDANRGLKTGLRERKAQQEARESKIKQAYAGQCNAD